MAADTVRVLFLHRTQIEEVFLKDSGIPCVEQKINLGILGIQLHQQAQMRYAHIHPLFHKSVLTNGMKI